jgi:hypothetical protein
MIKSARNQSPDLVRDELRQKKKTWNKEVSSLIDDVINFKKLINGSPNTFFQQKSRLIDPIPGNPGEILSKLTSRYNDIAQKAQDITEHQKNYSENKRKKPSQEIKKAFLDLEDTNLLSEGSNIFSRYFTKILNPTFGPFGWGEGGKARRTRIGLLDSLADLYKNLRKFERELGSGYLYRTIPSAEDVANANASFKDAQRSWNTIISLFARTVNKTVDDISKEEKERKEREKTKEKPTEKPPETVDGEAGKEKEKSSSTDTPTVSTDSGDSEPRKRRRKKPESSDNESGTTDIEQKPAIPTSSSVEQEEEKNELKSSSLQQKFNSFSNELLKNDIARSIRGLFIAYNRLPVGATEKPTILNMIENQMDRLEKSSNTPEDQGLAVASFLANYYLLSLGKDLPAEQAVDAYRDAMSADITSVSKETREIINDIMNSLEREFNPESLISMFSKVNENIESIKSKYDEILYPGLSSEERRRLREKRLRDTATDLSRVYPRQ